MGKRIGTSAALAVALAVTAATPVLAEVTYDVVALTGITNPMDPRGPGIGPNAKYSTGLSNSIGIFSVAPDGRVMLRAKIQGTGITSNVNDFLLRMGMPGALNTIIRRGDQAPTLSSGVILKGAYFTPGGFNGDSVILGGSLANGDVTTDNNSANFQFGSSGTVVLRKGTEALGISSPTPFMNPQLGTLTPSGKTAFLANLAGPGIDPGNDIALYVGPTNTPQFLAREGDLVPSLGIGASTKITTFLGRPYSSDIGDTYISADLSGADNSSITRAFLHFAPSGNGQVLFKNGVQSIPGLAGTPSVDFLGGLPGVSTNGKAVSLTALSGTGYDSTNNNAVLLANNGQVSVIAQKGTLVDSPDLPAGATWSLFYTGNGFVPQVNASGRVLFTGTYTTSGIDQYQALFVHDAASATRAAIRSGDSSPVGGVFDSFIVNGRQAQLAEDGSFVFMAGLKIDAAAGISDANDWGLFYYGTDSQIIPIVREGDVIDVDPGSGTDLRTVDGTDAINFAKASGHGFTSTGEDGYTQFNGRDLIYGLAFTDGFQGIFVSHVPEPASIGVLALGIVMGLRRRSR